MDVVFVELVRRGGAWEWEGVGQPPARGWNPTSAPGRVPLGVQYEARRRRGDGAWELECQWDVSPPPEALGIPIREFPEVMYAGIPQPVMVALQGAPDAHFVVGVVTGGDGVARFIAGYLAHGGWVRHTCTAEFEQTTIAVAAFDQGGPTLGVTVTPRVEGEEWVLDCEWDPPPVAEVATEWPTFHRTAIEALSSALPESHRIVETAQSPRGDRVAAVAVASNRDPLVAIAVLFDSGWAGHAPMAAPGSWRFLEMTSQAEPRQRVRYRVSASHEGGGWTLSWTRDR